MNEFSDLSDKVDNLDRAIRELRRVTAQIIYLEHLVSEEFIALRDRLEGIEEDPVKELQILAKAEQ